MGAYEFGRLVDRVIRERGLSQARVSILIGELPDGRVLNEKAVERIREGGRRLDPVLVTRLIQVLELDEAEAWNAAGLWPPTLTLEQFRALRQRPLEPALTRVGGSEPPRPTSLRLDPADRSQQGDATTGTLFVVAGRKWRLAEGSRTGQEAA